MKTGDFLCSFAVLAFPNIMFRLFIAGCTEVNSGRVTFQGHRKIIKCKFSHFRSEVHDQTDLTRDISVSVGVQPQDTCHKNQTPYPFYPLTVIST